MKTIPLRALVVDDAEITRFAAARFLEEFDIETDESKSYDETMEILKGTELDNSKRYEFVVLDWQLSKLETAEGIIQWLRQYQPECKIIVLSGKFDEFSGGCIKGEAHCPANRLNADYFISKPTKLVHLKEALLSLSLIK